MKRQLLLFPILLGLVLVSCDEKKDAAQAPPSDTIYPLTSLQSQDTTYKPQSKELFQELVYKEYAYQATRIPKKQADSLMRSVLARVKDPGKMEGELQKAMAPLKNRYDSLARRVLADKYHISLDSVQAIIDEMKDRKKEIREKEEKEEKNEKNELQGKEG